MDPSQSEQAYIELRRILLINNMCQGEYPFTVVQTPTYYVDTLVFSEFDNLASLRLL